MRLVSLHCLAIAAAALSACLAQLANAGQLPPTFVSLYRPALARLQAAYSKVAVDGTIRVELPSEGKSSDQKFAYHADGDQRRLDLTTTAQNGIGLQVGASELSMATPNGSLNTYRKAGSDFFDDAQERQYAGVVQEIDRRSLMNLPYSLDSSGTILDMLLRSNVKVGGVKWVREKGTPLVQVTYQENATHAGQSGLWNSTILLSPDDSWALRSFNRTLTGSRSYTQRGTLEYSTGADGVPLVQSITMEISEGNRVIRRESVSVNGVQFGAFDPEWFDSFGF